MSIASHLNNFKPTMNTFVSEIIPNGGIGFTR